MSQCHCDRPAQREWIRLAASAGVGVACGVAAKLADGSALRWLSDAANYPAAYVLALALVARFSPTAPLAALRASAFFTSLCLAYYGWSQYVLGFLEARYLLAWSALAVTLVPAVAAVMWWASRRSGVVAGLITAAIAAVPLAEGPLRQLWIVHVQHVELPLLHPVQAALAVVVATVVAGLLPRRTRTRVVAVAFTLPMYLILDGAEGWLRTSLGV